MIHVVEVDEDSAVASDETMKEIATEIEKSVQTGGMMEEKVHNETMLMENLNMSALKMQILYQKHCLPILIVWDFPF